MIINIVRDIDVNNAVVFQIVTIFPIVKLSTSFCSESEKSLSKSTIETYSDTVHEETWDIFHIFYVTGHDSWPYFIVTHDTYLKIEATVPV